MRHDVATRPARRHGDLMRAWRPAEQSRTQRVERLYDASGRVRAERATTWQTIQSEIDLSGIAGDSVAAAVGIFVILMPAVFVACMAVVGVLSGWLGAILFVGLWAMVVGVEGLMLSALLAAAWLTIWMILGVILGPTAALAVVCGLALVLGILVARAV